MPRGRQCSARVLLAVARRNENGVKGRISLYGSPIGRGQRSAVRMHQDRQQFGMRAGLGIDEKPDARAVGRLNLVISFDNIKAGCLAADPNIAGGRQRLRSPQSHDARSHGAVSLFSDSHFLDSHSDFQSCVLLSWHHSEPPIRFKIYSIRFLEVLLPSVATLSVPKGNLKCPTLYSRRCVCQMDL